MNERNMTAIKIVMADARNSRSAYFTDKKLYIARPYGPFSLYEVRDDRGRERYISLSDNPCPHFVSSLSEAARQLHHGRFIEI